MGKWIRRRYKSSCTSASPQESFWRGRWIWIPIRKRIVHIQVICCGVSAAQISSLPSSSTTTPPESFAERDSSRHPRLKCSWMKWQVAITPPTLSQKLPSSPPRPGSYFIEVYICEKKEPPPRGSQSVQQNVGNIGHNLMLTTSDERVGDVHVWWKCMWVPKARINNEALWQDTINNNKQLLKQF